MLSYIGGKSKIGKWIVPFYPTDMETYVETFGGMFWCFFNMYAYVLTQVFSGSKPETSSFIDLKGKYKSKYLTFRDKLSKPEWVEHFNRISEFRLGDFEDVIKEFDSPTTYFYVDPPYWKTENYYSNHDFDREDHERLADCLKGIEGKFSLSYYDFQLLNEWFPKEEYKWEKKEFAKAAAAKKGKTQNMGEELLIMNY